MAEDNTQTKISRLEGGMSTRIPKPSNTARPTTGLVAPVAAASKLLKPTINGFSLQKSAFQPPSTESNTITAAAEGDTPSVLSGQFPRKTFLRRFGAANKINTNRLPVTVSQPQSQIPNNQPSSIGSNGRAMSESAASSECAMEPTKTLAETTTTLESTDRCLTRSNTFVCETNGDTQAKLLSLTHNINAPVKRDIVNQQQLQANNKERTSKRSLSPIYGDAMNIAKRKSVQPVSLANRTVLSAPLLISTPRVCGSADLNEKTFPIFTVQQTDAIANTKLSATSDTSQTFTLDNTMVLFEPCKDFTPDAIKSNAVFSSTVQCNRLLDLTQKVVSSKVCANNEQQLFAECPTNQHMTQLLYVHPVEDDAATMGADETVTIVKSNALNNGKNDDVDLKKTFNAEKTQPIQIGSGPMNDELMVAKHRFSLGLDLTECTLDCSIELCDSSAATSAQDSSPLVNYKPHNSFEMDESLGILTPDQMVEFLDSNATNTNNLELPLSLPAKLPPHKCRIDQTPSPEELPLDPVEVKTYESKLPIEISVAEQQCEHDIPSQSDSYSKADQMTKSTTSKTTNSFITSVTSIASLDNGYQGDGEMSRPASRGGGGENSPMNVRRVHNERRNKLEATYDHNDNRNIPILRRQDPMTDSDFFTESDADNDIFHRGDRRVQIIDGHMYNGHGADVFIDEPQHNEYSGMDSSGIYTDVENRGEEDVQSNERNEIDSDMSPDGSTDTIKSSEYVKPNKKSTAMTSSFHANQQQLELHQQQQQQHQLQKQIVLSEAWTASPTQSTQSIVAVSDSSLSTVNDVASSCTCEKNSSGDRQLCVVINDASSNNAGKTLSPLLVCTLHSNSRTNLNRNSFGTYNDDNPTETIVTTHKPSLYHVPTAPGTKVKKSSPNRKQNKNEANVALKRNEMSKRELKTYNGKVRSSKCIAICKENKSPDPEASETSNEIGQCNSNNGSLNGDRVAVVLHHVRKVIPNKWDEVMNKIALNKAAEVKTTKKYSEVKSKVTSGLKRNSPCQIKSPSSERSTSELGVSDGLATSRTKVITSSTTKKKSPLPLSRQSTHGVARRSIERDSSKDSQLSSCRDLSSSPSNNLSKPTSPSTRTSAKKRYERSSNTIQNGFSTSSNNKVEGTTGGNAAVKPIALHKRYSPNNTIQSTTNTTSLPPSEKRVAISPGKKSTSISANSKRMNQTNSAGSNNKTSHIKEHSHQTPTPPHSPIINNNSNSINNNNNNHQQHQNNTKTGTNSTKLPLNGEQLSVIASIHRNGKSSTTPVAASTIVTVPKIQEKHQKQNQQPQHQSNGKPKGTINTSNSNSKSVINGELNEKIITTPSEIVDSDTIDHAAPVKTTTITTTFRNKLVAASLPLPTNIIDPSLIHANKGIVALGVMVQHLTFNLKAFETPSLCASLEIAKDKLAESQTNLEMMLTKFGNLEEQVVAKENYYNAREKEFKEFSEQEMEKIKSCLYQMEQSAKEQIHAMECQLAEERDQHVEALKACQTKADARCRDLEMQLQLSRDKEIELMKRLNEFSVTENQLRDKVLASEHEFANRLQAATLRERELNEKLIQMNRQLQAAECQRRESDDRSKLLQDENVVLRQRRNSNGGCANNSNGSPTAINLSFQGTAANQSQMLQDEVESLRCVLELKQNEISELRKLNHELQTAHDELPRALIKISALESRLEDLNIQYHAKVEEEKELNLKNKSLQESYQLEIKNRNRLSLHNEELQWKLKQNSEKFTTTLNELSKSYQDRSHFLSDCKNSLYGSILETTNESNSDKIDCFQMDNISPPTSPVIKGVVEKSDSVSWVLEINDDESPEAMASRMVKRAGSFRSSCKERSPSFKRQLSLGGANVLSQSASATSLLRQHSESPNQCHGPSPKQSKTPRNRSQSLTANNEPRKVVRSSSGAMPCDYAKWQEPLLSSSSPLNMRIQKSLPNGESQNILVATKSHSEQAEPTSTQSRARSSSVSADDVEVEFLSSLLPTDRKSGLITCDSSALSAPRPDMCFHALLPNHNSVQKMKKCQQIKESAGEAMVSGMNSEDETSFGSRSDVDSMSASSSSATSPSHSEVNKRHLCMDEEALMHKIVASLNSTPMEVSWSEDGDNEHYAHESSA